jgi:hypothetical protein
MLARARWQSGKADGSVFQYTVQVVRMLQLRPSSQPLARMDFSTNRTRIRIQTCVGVSVRFFLLRPAALRRVRYVGAPKSKNGANKNAPRREAVCFGSLVCFYDRKEPSGILRFGIDNELLSLLRRRMGTSVVV